MESQPPLKNWIYFMNKKESLGFNDLQKRVYTKKIQSYILTK